MKNRLYLWKALRIIPEVYKPFFWVGNTRFQKILWLEPLLKTCSCSIDFLQHPSYVFCHAFITTSGGCQFSFHFQVVSISFHSSRQKAYLMTHKLAFQYFRCISILQLLFRIPSCLEEGRRRSEKLCTHPRSNPESSIRWYCYRLEYLYHTRKEVSGIMWLWMIINNSCTLSYIFAQWAVPPSFKPATLKPETASWTQFHLFGPHRYEFTMFQQICPLCQIVTEIESNTFPIVRAISL